MTSSLQYFDQYFKTNNSFLKLANLKILKQARDLQLISEEQYKEKQMEFLKGIDFALERERDNPNSIDVDNEGMLLLIL